MVGLNQNPDLIAIQRSVVEQLSSSGIPSNFNQAFQLILNWENILCKAVEVQISQVSQGTAQLIGEIANQSEMRQFKLKQRIK
jgi:hypothetical protein